MAYFLLSTGLRGCYMPDSARIIEVRTRAVLREIVKQEADYQKGDGDLRYIGLSDRAQSAFVREAWARRKDPRWTRDLALPFYQRGNAGPTHGIFLARATRDDYVNQGEDF